MALSREVFSKNLRMYMERRGVTQKELAEIVGVSAPTMHDWVKGKMFPRIDKIEIMADYFGILKSDLIEEKSEEQREMHKKNNDIANIVVKLRTDEVFLSIVNSISELDVEQLQSVSAFLQYLKNQVK